MFEAFRFLVDIVLLFAPIIFWAIWPMWVIYSVAVLTSSAVDVVTGDLNKGNATATVAFIAAVLLAFAAEVQLVAWYVPEAVHPTEGTYFIGALVFIHMLVCVPFAAWGVVGARSQRVDITLN